MADTPALAPEYGYYQRLLARDQSEAADLIERHIKTEPPRVGLRRPAAAGAQLRGARSPGAAAVAGRRSGRHRCDAGAAVGCGGFDPAAEPEPPAPLDESPLPAPREPLRVLGYAANGAADELALMMLAHLLADLPIAVEITGRMLASELVALVQRGSR